MNRYPIILYLGDAITIFLFALIGRQTHSMATGLSAFGATFSTASPFILAWLLIAPWFGAFRPPAWASIISTIKTIVIAFIPSFIVAVLLRAIFIGRFSPLIFYVVTAATILLMLLIWRLFYTLVLAPRLAR